MKHTKTGLFFVAMGTIAFSLAVAIIYWAKTITALSLGLLVFGFSGASVGWFMIDPGSSDSFKALVVIIQGLPIPLIGGRRKDDPPSEGKG